MGPKPTLNYLLRFFQQIHLVHQQFVQCVVEFKDAHTTKSPTFDVAFVLMISLLSVKDPAYKIPSD